MENKQAQDILVRGTALEGSIRVFAVRTTRSLEELRRRHGMSPTATAALGRTVSAGAMMGGMLKGEDKLTLQVKGDGPLGQIVVDANAKGDVRGYVHHPFVDPPRNEQGKLDVATAVGREGSIYVIKDLGMKEPYRGNIPIISGELAEDFTYYFAKSEQTPSAVALGVLVDTDTSVKQSGGYIIQLMPEVPDSEISRLEKILSDIPSVTEMMEQGMGPVEMLEKLFPTVRIMEQTHVQFQCQCSRERVSQMIRSVGAEELQSMINEDQGAEVICHFCNEKYQFDEDQLTKMIPQQTE